jgi:predicted TIM-barrel fold metal-dependent hydrolase
LIIDGHIHAGHWSEGMFLGRGVPFEEMEACLVECGLDGAILTATDLRKNQEVIDFIAERGTKKYWFFPWVNPSLGEDLDFLIANRARVAGIKIHPSCDHVPVTDERVVPFLEFARRHGLPVMVHCGRWQEMSGYALALETAARYPKVDFILSHMGGDQPELAMGTIDAITGRGLSNVYLGTEGVREYWAVQRAVDEIGADRVIFGSDFPLGHPRMYLGLIDALRISREQRDSILGGNVVRLLGGVI